MNDELMERVQHLLPYEGATDVTSFVYLACCQLAEKIESEKPKRKRS